MGLQTLSFLFGCTLTSAEREYHFPGGGEELEEQLTLHTASLGAGVRDQLHVLEAEGVNYEGKSVRTPLISFWPSVQTTVPLAGLELTPPVTFRLKAGTGPLHVSGQHLVAREDESFTVIMKRVAPRLPPFQKKSKPSIFVDDIICPFKLTSHDLKVQGPSNGASVVMPPALACNGENLMLQPTLPTASEGEKSPPKPKKHSTPKKPLKPWPVDKIKSTIKEAVNKGVILPKLFPKFQSYLKNSFHLEDPVVVRDLWKWKNSL